MKILGLRKLKQAARLLDKANCTSFLAMEDVIDFEKYKKRKEISDSQRDIEIKQKAAEILKQATQLLMLVVADDI